MSSTVIGMLLAFAAAVALNGSYLMQHAGSAGMSAIDVRRPLATLAALFRSPLWLVGSAAGVAGWLLHIEAMREAPLSIVQACVAGGLVVAAPMAAIGLHRGLARDEAHAIALMVVALVLLSVGLPGGRAAAHDGLALALWMAALVAGAAALAVRAGGAHRPLALGVAGGLLYGAADLALKAVTGLRGGADVLGSPWLAAGLLVTVGAFFAFQRGLQGDRPVAVIAAMTAATNVSSILGAFVIFDDPLGRTPQLAAVHVLAFVLVIVAASRLAPAAVRLPRRPRAR